MPSFVNLMRVAFVLFLTAAIAYWIYFERYLPRTIVVEAETGTLRVVLEAELSGKTLRDLWICQKIDAEDELVRRDNGAEPAPQSASGCRSRTHRWIGPMENGAPILPAGTELKITSWPDALRIDIDSVPDRFEDTETARLEGGALVLASATGLEALGTLQLSGRVEIGARPSETDQISIVSGNYQVRGYTLFGRLRGEMRQLRGGSLLAGALIRFVEPNGAKATGHVAIMLPDRESSLMRVTAISGKLSNDDRRWEPANSNLGVQYYFTDEVVIRPSIFDALILDPFVQFLAMVFGAIAGFGWLKRLLGIGSKKKFP